MNLFRRRSTSSRVTGDTGDSEQSILQESERENGEQLDPWTILSSMALVLFPMSAVVVFYVSRASISWRLSLDGP